MTVRELRAKIEKGENPTSKDIESEFQCDGKLCSLKQYLFSGVFSLRTYMRMFEVLLPA
jgi:hypothetical protein